MSLGRIFLFFLFSDKMTCILLHLSLLQFNFVPSKCNALPPALYLNIWTMCLVNSHQAQILSLALHVSLAPFSSGCHGHPMCLRMSSPRHTERNRKLSIVDLSWDTQIRSPLFSLTNLSSPGKLQPWARQCNFYSGPIYH